MVASVHLVAFASPWSRALYCLQDLFWSIPKKKLSDCAAEGLNQALRILLPNFPQLQKLGRNVLT